LLSRCFGEGGIYHFQKMAKEGNFEPFSVLLNSFFFLHPFFLYSDWPQAPPPRPRAPAAGLRPTGHPTPPGRRHYRAASPPRRPNRRHHRSCTSLPTSPFLGLPDMELPRKPDLNPRNPNPKCHRLHHHPRRRRPCRRPFPPPPARSSLAIGSPIPQPRTLTRHCLDHNPGRRRPYRRPLLPPSSSSCVSAHSAP
jgi:hypothetical protein